MASPRKKSYKQSNLNYRLMLIAFKIIDFFWKTEKKVAKLGIQSGQTVVDFGCGPGRYIPKLSELVGSTGKVYAADIHEMGLAKVEQKIQQLQLANVETVKVADYQSPIPDNTADFVLALDMFHQILDPMALLTELHRILKPGGTLILEDGHQPHAKSKAKLRSANLFEIVAESKAHLKCRPIINLATNSTLSH